MPSSCARLAVLAVALFARAMPGQESIASLQSQIRQGHYASALEGISRQLKVRPNDEKLWTLEGIAYSLNGEEKPALAAFDRALKLAPNEPAALRGEAELLFKTGDPRAAPIVRRILKLDSRDQTAHEMLAMLERQRGDCAAANDQFALATDALAAHPASLEAAGDCLVQTRRYSDAALTFHRLATTLPDQTFPAYDEAVAWLRQKEYARAAEILDPLLDRIAAAGHVDSDVLSLASEAKEGLGDTPQAVALLRRAIVADPRNPDLYNAFVGICLNHDSYQVGIDMVNAGIAFIPNNASLYLSRGLLYTELAQYEKAEKDFDSAEKIDSLQGISAYAADLAEMQTHHPEATVRKVQEQLQQHPENPMLHFVLADLLANQQSTADLAEARRQAERAIRLRPDYAEAHVLLASLLLRNGDAAGSAQQSREALKYAPDDQPAIFHLILALKRSGVKGDSGEMQSLVKRLSALKQQSLKEESGKKRFRLEETSPTGSL